MMWTKKTTSYELQWKHGSITVKDTLKIFPEAYVITKSPLSELMNALTIEPSIDQTRGQRQSLNQIVEFLSKIPKKVKLLQVVGDWNLLQLVGQGLKIAGRIMVKVIYYPEDLRSIIEDSIYDSKTVKFGRNNKPDSEVYKPHEVVVILDNSLKYNYITLKNSIAEIIRLAFTYDEQFYQYLTLIKFDEILGDKYDLNWNQIIRKFFEFKIAEFTGTLPDGKSRIQGHKSYRLGFTIASCISEVHGHKYHSGDCLALGMIKELQIAQSCNALTLDNSYRINTLQHLFRTNRLVFDFWDSFNSQAVVNLLPLQHSSNDSELQPEIQLYLMSDAARIQELPTKIPFSQLSLQFSQQVEVKYIGNIRQNQTKFKFKPSDNAMLKMLYIGAVQYLNIGHGVLLDNIPYLTLDMQAFLKVLNKIGFTINYSMEHKKLAFMSYVPIEKVKEPITLEIGSSHQVFFFVLILSAYLAVPIVVAHEIDSSLIRHYKQMLTFCEQEMRYRITFLLEDKVFPIRLDPLEERRYSFAMERFPLYFADALFMNSAFCNSLSRFSVHGIDMAETWNCLKHFGADFKIRDKQIYVQRDQMTPKKYVEISSDPKAVLLSYMITLLHETQFSGTVQPLNSDQVAFEQQLRKLVDLPESEIPYDLQLDLTQCPDYFLPAVLILFVPKFQKSIVQNLVLTLPYEYYYKEQNRNRIDLIIDNLRELGMHVDDESINSITVQKIAVEEMEHRDMVYFRTANYCYEMMGFSVLATLLSKAFPDRKYIVDKFPLYLAQFHQYFESIGIQINGQGNFLLEQQKAVTQQKTNKLVKRQKVFRKNDVDWPPIIQNILIQNQIPKPLPQEDQIVYQDDKETMLIEEVIKLKTGQLFLQNRHISIKSQNFILFYQSKVSHKVLRAVAKVLGFEFISIESRILKNIRHQLGNQQLTFQDYVKEKGLESFQKHQKHTLMKIINGFSEFQQKIILVHESVLTSSEVVDLIDQTRKKLIPIYIQKTNSEASEFITEFNFKFVDYIFTINTKWSLVQQAQYFAKSFAALENLFEMPPGDILRLDTIIEIQKYFDLCPKYVAIEFRIDKILKTGLSLTNLRKSLSEIRLKHRTRTILNFKDTISYNQNDLTAKNVGAQAAAEVAQRQAIYRSCMDELIKIPTQFLTHQIQYPIWYRYNQEKLFLDYTGSNKTKIDKMLLLDYSTFPGIKRLSYIREQNQPGEDLLKSNAFPLRFSERDILLRKQSQNVMVSMYHRFVSNFEDSDKNIGKKDFLKSAKQTGTKILKKGIRR